MRTSTTGRPNSCADKAAHALARQHAVVRPVKRDKAAQSLPEWETLRETASQIKAHTMSRLADYLEQFERRPRGWGACIGPPTPRSTTGSCWSILRQHGVRDVVKSKSMLTEECHLNPFLERHGIEVVDTDLGERIVQLAGEAPSHIVLPAIHKKKEDVGQLFHEHLGHRSRRDRSEIPGRSRAQHLRDKFMQADAGLTGVNFAIAETGGLVVCTNEGNADLGVSLPKLHIASHGDRKADSAGQRLGGVSAVAGPLGHRANRSPPIRRTFMARGRAANCTSCWSTMGAAASWPATIFAAR